MKQYRFKDNFLFGSSTSGPQSEGFYDKANKSIWDYWFEIAPDKFHNKVGPVYTSNFFRDYKEDIKLIKETGHNVFRTSIQWSRIIKNFNTLELDEKAVEFYNNVIDELIKNDIEPIMCLYHFDMPLKLQEIGGFENREVVELYAKYASKMFELYGDKVKKWFTFNEPIVVAEGGYLYKFHYPEVVSFKRAIQVAYNMNLASAKAVKAFKESGKTGDIGIILNLTPSYPRDENNKEDLKASHICDLLFNRSFLDPAAKGEFPEDLVKFVKENNITPICEQGDKELLKENTITLLGINYYQPRRVKARETEFKSDTLMPEHFFEPYEMPNRLMNPYRGWEIYYKGIYDIAKNIQDNYSNMRWLITENGIGVENEERFIKEGVVEDDYRIEFVTEHLKWLHKAIEEGSNCLGYLMWTPIDCWSWLNSYKNRYGFIRCDLETGKKTIKKSGHWFRDLVKNKGFDA